MVANGLLRLSLVAPWFILLWFATLIGRNCCWCRGAWWAIEGRMPDVALAGSLNLRLLNLEMWTYGSDVTDDAVVMTGGQASFVWMLLDILCRIMVSILTNDISLTFYMSPMRRDIFCWGRIFNFTFPQSILLNLRPVGFQQITISPNMTNFPTIMTSRKKLTFCSWFLGFWHQMII